MRITPTRDRVLLRLEGHADVRETRLVLPDHGASASRPCWARILGAGDGRRDAYYNRAIPSIIDLGWQQGDKVIALPRFSRGTTPGTGDIMVEDYDILARVVSGEEGDYLDPNWGRIVLQRQRQERRTSVGGILLLTPDVDFEKQALAVAHVHVTAPALLERTEAEGGARRETAVFNGIIDNVSLGFWPGDRVVYRRYSAWRVVLAQDEFVIVNFQDVLAVVPEECEVDLR